MLDLSLKYQRDASNLCSIRHFFRSSGNLHFTTCCRWYKHDRRQTQFFETLFSTNKLSLHLTVFPVLSYLIIDESFQKVHPKIEKFLAESRTRCIFSIRIYSKNSLFFSLPLPPLLSVKQPVQPTRAFEYFVFYLLFHPRTLYRSLHYIRRFLSTAILNLLPTRFLSSLYHASFLVSLAF